MALPSLFPENAVGIELGVSWGYFSNVILMSKAVKRLFSVDCWADHHNDDEYVAACRLLAKHGTRSVVMRSYFDEVLHLFPDLYFDFIYIDAYAHTGQENGTLLDKWYPKLKTCGIFAGHDYDPDAWLPTVEAVDKFANSHGKRIVIIPGVRTSNDQDIYPSWYFVK